MIPGLHKKADVRDTKAKSNKAKHKGDFSRKGADLVPQLKSQQFETKERAKHLTMQKNRDQTHTLLYWLKSHSKLYLSDNICRKKKI